MDAPHVMWGLLLSGAVCLVLAFALPRTLHLGPFPLGLKEPVEVLIASRSFLWPAAFLLGEGCLFLLYVKVGKFRQRDGMLARVPWRGDERVLDVGCGRGLLLIGAAKRLTSGHATGLDLWSKVDMGANSPEATEKNLALEGVASRCTLVSGAAQEMTFPDGSFDVVLSLMCLHNIRADQQRRAAIQQIARVLRPGGVAVLSDYKKVGEYAETLRACGLAVDVKTGSFLRTFPPVATLVARKSV